MRLIFSERAWGEYLFWQEHDRATLKRVNALLRDAARTPESGLGKPEPLKHEFAGYWSRRISEEHRFIYRVEGDGLLIAQLRFHY